MDMNKTCGTCGKCRNTHDGPYCYKGSSPRPVSTLRVMDCWVDPADVEKEPQATKVCSRCGRELPISNFGRHSRTKDGYQPCCRECQSTMNKGHRKRQPDEHNEAPAKAPELTAEQMGIGKGRRPTHPSYVDKDTGITMKWCKVCNQYKPIDEFHHNKANKDGHEFDCKVCHNARVTEGHRRKRAEKKAQKEAEAAAKVPTVRIGVDYTPVKKEPTPDPLEGITLRQFLTSLRSLGFQGTITFEL